MMEIEAKCNLHKLSYTFGVSFSFPFMSKDKWFVNMMDKLWDATILCNTSCVTQYKPQNKTK